MPVIDFWFSAHVDPHSFARGSQFTVRLIGLPFKEQFTYAWVELARVEWRETTWWSGSGGDLAIEDSEVRVQIPRLDVPPGVYSVSQLRFSLGPGADSSNVIEARAGRNFPRFFVQVFDHPSSAATQSAIAERVQVIEEAREHLFRRGIVADPHNPGIGRFRGFAFVTRSLVTRRMRLGQLEILPLKRGLRSVEQAAIINQVLVEFGSRPILDVEGDWSQISERAFPLMLVHFPLVYARHRDEAIAAVERHSLAVIDVLSPNRISHGEPLAFIVESLDSPNRGCYRPAFEGYRGNIIGGFLSGEDPETVRSHLENVLGDPMLHLFVSLFREATGESSLDFAYFRFWNLLEAIATRRIQATATTQVSTFAGQLILSPKGSPVTTLNDTARVYQLIKTHFQAMGVRESFLLGALALQDLWSVCRVWAGRRNATAHYGGFDPNNAEQSQKAWFRLTNQARVEVSASGGTPDLFSDGYFRALAETARLIVMREVQNPT